MRHDAYAQTVMERCDILTDCSEEPDPLTRRFATAAMRQAQKQVAAWMRAAGMTVRRDNVGRRESNPGFEDIPEVIEKAIQV